MAMKVVRVLGMALMVIWMVNAAAHLLLAFLEPARVVFHLFGGVIQFGIALWLFRWILSRHMRPPPSAPN